jgi:glycosyltransferase involved in cell wall biosynthesis
MTPTSDKLTILQVAASATGGGGDQISLRLHRGFRRAGHRSILFVGHGSAQPEEEVFHLPDRWQASRRGRALFALYQRVLGLTRGRGANRLLPVFEAVMFPRFQWDLWRGNEDFTQPGSRRLLALAPQPPDVILLHNLHARWHRREGFFDLSFLESLSRSAPVILAPQDPWLLTGHCAHPIECPRWRTGCGLCPDLTIYPSVRRDATAANWRRKRAIYARSRLNLVTPSRWLSGMVDESGMALAGRACIANGVDPAVFFPGPSERIRAELGLPMDRKIILVSGNAMRTNPWKGFAWLVEVARLLAGDASVTRTDILCVGDDGEPMDFGKVRVTFAGRVLSPDRMADYYRAADVYFHPSRADTAPFSVLEAMSSGLPVVATAVGGIPEQVEDGRSGFLAPPGGVRPLADHLTLLLADPERARQMGEYGRRRVLAHFLFSRQTEDLLAWMSELAGRRPAAG